MCVLKHGNPDILALLSQRWWVVRQHGSAGSEALLERTFAKLG